VLKKGRRFEFLFAIDSNCFLRIAARVRSGRKTLPQPAAVAVLPKSGQAFLIATALGEKKTRPLLAAREAEENYI
jgi:hypothetical protein